MKSTTLISTGNTTDFTTRLSPSIRLDPNKKYEAALLSINLFNTIPNITEENNKFRYSTDNGVTWKIISLNIGAYEIIGINDEIQRQMTINGDYDSVNNEQYISITTKIAESKCILNITNQNYRVDFGIPNSIASTLGFHSVIISQKYNISQEIVDITKINSVLVNTDIISGSYVNGTQSPAIYAFDPNIVSPGYKINECPNPSLIYYPVNRTDINSIRIWLTDQTNKLINLRGERVTVRLHIREVKDIEKQIINAFEKINTRKNIIVL
jgi:hypothetical protein